MLDREAIIEAFRALDEELAHRQVRANIFVVGGAAMAIAYDARRTTADIDAIFAPTAEVRDAARGVAARLGLSDDWLNDGAKAFMPGEDPDRIIVFEGASLGVGAASPRYLLAMKLLSARAERDRDDIRTLYELCGFTTSDQGMALVESAYPGHVIPPRTRFLLEEMYPSITPRRHADRGKDRDTGLGIGF